MLSVSSLYSREWKSCNSLNQALAMGTEVIFNLCSYKAAVCILLHRCFLQFFKKINLFIYIYFLLRWVFVAARRLSLVVASRGYSSLWCAGFSLWWLFLLQSMGSRHAGLSSCGSRAPERRLCSCGARA